MNNEPVAWMYEDASGTMKMLGNTRLEKWVTKFGCKEIPLYTHPAKCNKCNDTEWVCENHPNQEAHKCIHCGGAGMPCECTHPVKELTDEEILEVITMSHSWIDGYPKKYALDFARAILKKASEK